MLLLKIFFRLVILHEKKVNFFGVLNVPLLICCDLAFPLFTFFSLSVFNFLEFASKRHQIHWSKNFRI